MPKESYSIHYKSLSPYEFFNSTLSSSQFNLCFRQIQDIEIFKSELKFTGILGEKTMRHSKSISIHSHLLTPSFFPINFLRKIASRQLRNILKLDKIGTDRLNSLSRDVDPHSGSRASNRVRGRTRDASKREGEGVVRPSCLHSQTTRDHICRICTFHLRPSPTFSNLPRRFGCGGEVSATFLQPV